MHVFWAAARCRTGSGAYPCLRTMMNMWTTSTRWCRLSAHFLCSLATLCASLRRPLASGASVGAVGLPWLAVAKSLCHSHHAKWREKRRRDALRTPNVGAVAELMWRRPPSERDLIGTHVHEYRYIVTSSLLMHTGHYTAGLRLRSLSSGSFVCIVFLVLWVARQLEVTARRRATFSDPKLCNMALQLVAWRCALSRLVGGSARMRRHVYSVAPGVEDSVPGRVSGGLACRLRPNRVLFLVARPCMEVVHR